MSNEFRELIDEKFNSINTKMDSQHEMNQLKFATIIEKANEKDQKIEELNKTVLGLIGMQSQHYTTCPNSKKIEDLTKDIHEEREKMNKRLLELDFFVKYPKWVLLGLGVVLILTWIQYISVKESLGNFSVKAERVEKLERDINSKYIEKETESILHNK